MNFGEYLEKMKNIQQNLLYFVDNEKNFDDIKQIFEDLKAQEEPHEIRLFLRIISKISENHHGCSNFFSKIEQILRVFKNDIKKYPNIEIFNIFKKSKRILLFIIEEKILIFDAYIAKKMITKKYLSAKYPHYFMPEIKKFINEKWFTNTREWVKEIKQELPDDFYDLRKEGENDSYICNLIRNDSVEEFVSYVNRNIISRNSTITKSIYETNSFLIKNQNESNANTNTKGVTLIEYAAFFGSIQIFNFLRFEGAKLTPSLWLFAIHGKNAELIHILEEQNIKPKIIANKYEITSYKECFKESIKCHQNDISDYILNNYLQNEDRKSHETFIQSLKYYNFLFIQNERINESSFLNLCQYDYYSLVFDLITNSDIDINKAVIRN